MIADGELMAQCHLSFCSPISKREPSLVASTLKVGRDLYGLFRALQHLVLKYQSRQKAAQKSPVKQAI